MDTSFELEDYLHWDDQKKEKTEDHEFFQDEVFQNHLQKKKLFQLSYTPKNIREESASLSNISQKGIVTKDQKYIDLLKESFDKVYPLFYLQTSQRKFLLEKISITKLEQKAILFSGAEQSFDDGGWACFILLEGEVLFFNNNSYFLDLINSIALFGYDGPIFQKRLSMAIGEKGSVIGVISRKHFLQLVQPYSQFATFISRNIRNKDKVLDDLRSFQSFVLSNIDKGSIDIAKLLELYRKINSCLHSKCNSEELDISAWAYSLNRLPKNLIETYIFILVNKPPRFLAMKEQLGDIMKPVSSNLRVRDTYSYLGGKNIVVMRDMESDVLDFMSNICIHLIESEKIRKRIASPLTIKELHDSGNDFEKTFEVFVRKTGLYIYEDEKTILKNFFGDTFGEKLIHLCINHQDITVSIAKGKVADKDSIEMWTQNLWSNVKEILGVGSWLSEIDDLVVDIFQGSKTTLLNCISPHLYKNKKEILEWAEKNKIQLKTKTFLNENDKLVAYSYYYYKTFPEKAKEKEEMNIKHGIVKIDNSYGTGVKILIVNVNKLDPDNVDPNIKVKPASKNHIILHLGYTFGNQSHDIIKPVIMLFEKKARSLNILGKCGGLVGNRSDIIVADSIFLDKTHELITLRTGDIELEKMKKLTNSEIHVGPMLTVAGTILQNYELLNFYKHVMGCVGLEMEGFYYAKEVENSIKHRLIFDKFITRMYYYVSDLPLDLTQTLTQEGLAVSWDEGVCSMNAIQRLILNHVMG